MATGATPLGTDGGRFSAGGGGGAFGTPAGG